MIPPDHFKKVCHYAQRKGVLFTPAEFEIIKSFTSHKLLPPHTVIMEQGKVVRTLYFLNSGIARLYRLHNGVDYTLGIVSVNDFLSTPLYLLNGELSSCALESLTDIDVLVWDRPGVEAMKQRIPRMYDMELAIMDRLLNWIQDSQIDAACMTAEERYQKIMAEQPEVIQQVPLKYIASLLGIHQDSLSRIRKTLGQK
ncbi:cAMP-binding domain of CRP or a regulatory subunit of cAMP-dependent protein kinases [Parapedobacter luteus]|uniref:cAMP-binding domain of CRP or a regulatory subunit of cAMP-dependent protein kinases n=1 Tax=Parapedobacter luteus TaxID=623280 RepID=A0A1T5EDW3_9SPHI|nr:cyclic nucleotide-binding domain-containing protein [Parapedobacter luteus]SKB82054.1 cAMP-binding domain of CRP or a regulatory subunit of cAMP-dependent protein kinases [Parapedobacter luteus]